MTTPVDQIRQVVIYDLQGHGLPEEQIEVNVNRAIETMSAENEVITGKSLYDRSLETVGMLVNTEDMLEKKDF